MTAKYKPNDPQYWKQITIPANSTGLGGVLLGTVPDNVHVFATYADLIAALDPLGYLPGHIYRVNEDEMYAYVPNYYVRNINNIGWLYANPDPSIYDFVHRLPHVIGSQNETHIKIGVGSIACFKYEAGSFPENGITIYGNGTDDFVVYQKSSGGFTEVELNGISLPLTGEQGIFLGTSSIFELTGDLRIVSPAALQGSGAGLGFWGNVIQKTINGLRYAAYFLKEAEYKSLWNSNDDGYSVYREGDVAVTDGQLTLNPESPGSEPPIVTNSSVVVENFNAEMVGGRTYSDIYGSLADNFVPLTDVITAAKLLERIGNRTNSTVVIDIPSSPAGNYQLLVSAHSSLQNYWKLDSNLRDSKNQLSLTNSGSVAFTDPLAGTKSALFDGSNYLFRENTFASAITPRSMGVIIKISSQPAIGDTVTFFSMGHIAPDYVGYTIEYQNVDDVVFNVIAGRYKNGVLGPQLEYAVELTLDVPHLLVYGMNSSFEETLYVDGVAVDTNTTDGSSGAYYGPLYEINVGKLAHNAVSRFVPNGTVIDEPFLLSDAITAGEVTALWDEIVYGGTGNTLVHLINSFGSLVNFKVNGTISSNGNKVIDVAEPTNPSDAVNLEHLNRTVGSLTLTEYLTNVASTDIVGYYQLSDSAATNTLESVALAPSTNDQLIFSYATEPGCPNLHQLQIATYNLLCNLNKTGSKSVTCYYELYKRDTDDVETLIGTSDTTEELTTFSVDYNTHLHLMATVVLAETDRLVIKFYANAGTGSITTVIIDGTAANFAISVSPSSLNQKADKIVPSAPGNGAGLDASGNLIDLGYVPFNPASFTDTAVTSKLITGFSSGAGTVAATDTILQAINKLDGNVAGKQASLGFTPENVSNKETSALDTSTTKYPCNNVVKAAVDLKVDKSTFITWTKIEADSITVTGASASGTVADLRTANDGNKVTVTEGTSTAGNLIVDFVGVTKFNWVKAQVIYDGSTTHALSCELYHWGSASWYKFDAIQTGFTSSGTLFENHDFFAPSPTPYIGTGGDAGKVRVRFDHQPGTGNASHRWYFDEVSLYN